MIKAEHSPGANHDSIHFNLTPYLQAAPTTRLRMIIEDNMDFRAHAPEIYEACAPTNPQLQPLLTQSPTPHEYSVIVTDGPTEIIKWFFKNRPEVLEDLDLSFYGLIIARGHLHKLLYNHMLTLGFELITTNDANENELTGEELEAALQSRLDSLSSPGDFVDAAGGDIYDTMMLEADDIAYAAAEPIA